MTWFDKQARARKRMDLEREALAASVEEVAAQQELWDEDGDEDEPSRSGKTSIIPPRLSLQSRPMPVVRIDQAKRATAERMQPLLEKSPSSSSQMAATGVPRLGRSTRVHLQAVDPVPTRERSTGRFYAADSTRSQGQGESGQRALNARGTDASLVRFEQSAAPASPFPPLISGSGVIKQGQKDATVTNPRVSERSVVVVTLTDNPGPVVVHYVSLYPRRGFTFHLSAPTAAPTSFNYVIWPF